MVDTTNVRCNHTVRAFLHEEEGFSIVDSPGNNFELCVVILCAIYDASFTSYYGSFIITFLTMHSLSGHSHNWVHYSINSKPIYNATNRCKYCLSVSAKHGDV